MRSSEVRMGWPALEAPKAEARLWVGGGQSELKTIHSSRDHWTAAGCALSPARLRPPLISSRTRRCAFSLFGTQLVCSLLFAPRRARTQASNSTGRGTRWKSQVTTCKTGEKARGLDGGKNGTGTIVSHFASRRSREEKVRFFIARRARANFQAQRWAEHNERREGMPVPVPVLVPFWAGRTNCCAPPSRFSARCTPDGFAAAAAAAAVASCAGPVAPADSAVLYVDQKSAYKAHCARGSTNLVRPSPIARRPSPVALCTCVVRFVCTADRPPFSRPTTPEAKTVHTTTTTGAYCPRNTHTIGTRTAKRPAKHSAPSPSLAPPSQPKWPPKIAKVNKQLCPRCYLIASNNFPSLVYATLHSRFISFY